MTDPMEHEFDEGDEILERLAAKTGMDVAEIRRLLAMARSDATHQALESLDDEAVPRRLRLTARAAAGATGQVITAIKKVETGRGEPLTPVPDGDDGLWLMRVFADTLRPDDPTWVWRPFTAWAFIVGGNPILVEGWLRKHGYPEAFAINASTCQVERAD